jgi:hypothetical protein
MTASSGDNFPRLVDELVPDIAVVAEDIGVGLEDQVRASQSNR